MDNEKILLLIFGMMLVTYLPRALPAVFLERIRFGKKAEKLLKLIPYTAMTSLIVPGIFILDAEYPFIGLVGGAIAAILAWLRLPVMVCVLSAITATSLLYAFLI